MKYTNTQTVIHAKLISERDRDINQYTIYLGSKTSSSTTLAFTSRRSWTTGAGSICARAFCILRLMRDFVLEKYTSICESTSFSTVLITSLPCLVNRTSLFSWWYCAAPVWRIEKSMQNISVCNIKNTTTSVNLHNALYARNFLYLSVFNCNRRFWLRIKVLLYILSSLTFVRFIIVENCFDTYSLCIDGSFAREVSCPHCPSSFGLFCCISTSGNLSSCSVKHLAPLHRH